MPDSSVAATAVSVGKEQAAAWRLGQVVGALFGSLIIVSLLQWRLGRTVLRSIAVGTVCLLVEFVVAATAVYVQGSDEHLFPVFVFWGLGTGLWSAIWALIVMSRRQGPATT